MRRIVGHQHLIGLVFVSYNNPNLSLTAKTFGYVNTMNDSLRFWPFLIRYAVTGSCTTLNHNHPIKKSNPTHSIYDNGSTTNNLEKRKEMNFLDVFGQLEDSRIDRKKLHPMPEILLLLLTLCVVICGEESWDD